jgi:hypothetical protein
LGLGKQVRKLSFGKGSQFGLVGVQFLEIFRTGRKINRRSHSQNCHDTQGQKLGFEDFHGIRRFKFYKTGHITC